MTYDQNFKSGTWGYAGEWGKMWKHGKAFRVIKS